MKRYSNIIILGLFLVAISALLYFVHYLIFRDVHHIFIYMVGDLAFLPLEVFLVVIVIERVLASREKQAMMQKLNMVIGAFFSEVGTDLLQRLLVCFEKNDDIRRHLDVKQSWSRKDFKNAIAFAATIKGEANLSRLDLLELKRFLVQKRNFLLALLENPNLLEYERFTDLLWATFHLTEELEARRSFKGLPKSDIKHMAGDIERVYRHLTIEWLYYVAHLKSKYPYLFSLVARTHPFQECPSPVVT
jgi:vacuolar-type H+-ATPase subunit I/STV1